MELTWSLKALDRNKSVASLMALSSSPVGGFVPFFPVCDSPWSALSGTSISKSGKTKFGHPYMVGALTVAFKWLLGFLCMHLRRLLLIEKITNGLTVLGISDQVWLCKYGLHFI